VSAQALLSADAERDVRVRTVPAVPPRLGRGLAALVAAVVVALAGGVLVLGISEGDPPPSQVLQGARHFVRGAHTVSYRVAESITSPVGTSGDQLVHHRQISGTDAFGRSSDFVVIDAGTAEEYRSVAATPGLWIRASITASTLAATRWAHAGGYAGFEAAAIATQSGQNATPAEITRAVILDEVSDGDILPALIEEAERPARHGSRVRTLNVVWDPGAVLGASGTAVSSLTGQVTVDAHDRPTVISVVLQDNPSTVVLRYVLTWDAPVTISAPASSDVFASF